MFVNVLLVRCMIELDWANLSCKILLNDTKLCVESIFHILYIIFANFYDLIKHLQRLVDFLDFFSSNVFIVYSPFGVFLFKGSDLSSEILTKTKMLLFKSSYNILKPP